MEYFSHNGVIDKCVQAVVSLFDINYGYGYGVYETLKLRRGFLYFADQHCQRLHQSAQVVGIDIPWSETQIEAQIRELIAANTVKDANIKVMCVGDSRGGSENAKIDLYILMINPLFPPRTLYRRGAKTITAHGERHFPTAKTLDMLLSAILYRRAKEHNAYDTLLINANQYITEGTRTNVFVTDGMDIYTPPHNYTLLGVTKKTVIECARMHSIAVHEQHLPWSEFAQWKGVFLTSTSSKIVPVVLVDDIKFTIPPLIKNMMAYYNDYLAQYVAENFIAV